MKKGLHKAFWRNFKFKYKLTVVNENTLEEVVGIHVSKLNGFSVLLFVCIVLFLIAATIVAFTPLRNYLPGYMNSEVRALVVDNALRADSLAEALRRQNMYVMNIQDIVRGRVKADTVVSMDSLSNLRVEELTVRSEEEERFRQEYESKELHRLRPMSETVELSFYRPLRGVVTVGFNPGERRYGVELATTEGENVLAASDGTVVFSAFTDEYGYVIQLQHEHDFMTVYKNCASLMKRTGDRVKGGDAIALAGKPEKEHSEPHLYFELWHKGQAINPSKYIVF